MRTTPLCRYTLPVFLFTTALFSINRGLAFNPHSRIVPKPKKWTGSDSAPIALLPAETTLCRQLSSSANGRSAGGSEGSSSDDEAPKTLRSKLRKVTGFSFTAFRATMRGITGFSLTALRTTLRAATGVSMTSVMSRILGLFPTWFRYFMQPFLVLYYAPLMIIRSWIGPTKTAKAEALAAHEKVVEGWKKAIEVAEGAQSGGYWPIHVDDDGNIVTALPPDPDAILDKPDINKALLESVEVADFIESEA